MIRKFRFLLLTILLIVCYLIIQYFVPVNQRGQFQNEAPVIRFDQDKINISVNSTKEDLLEGVHAYDKEDGDLSDQIIIESQSIFLSDQTRQINYIVFDKDEHVTKASRYVTYTDYTAPVFTMNDQLRKSKYSTAEITNIIHAQSCIDGDISNKITIMDVSALNDKTLNLKISVSDSTNTTSYLNVHYYLDDKQDIEIVLKDYLVYLKLGEAYDYRANIINVIEKLYQDTSLINYIDIDVPVMESAGIYEVTYSIHRSNGNNGITTMLVIVE